MGIHTSSLTIELSPDVFIVTSLFCGSLMLDMKQHKIVHKVLNCTKTFFSVYLTLEV